MSNTKPPFPASRTSIPPAPPSMVPPARPAAPTRTRRGPKRGRPGGSFTQHRRLARLQNVLESHPRGLSLDDLASALHVTTRSVRRYLKELAQFTALESVPTLPGAAHEWRIKPSERGRAVALRRTQAYGLLAPRSVFDVFKGTALYDELDIGLGMLVSLAQRPTRGRSVGDIPIDQRLEERFRYAAFPPRGYSGRGEVLDELFRAVAESRETRMRVVVSEGSDLIIAHPYALVIHRGELFCVANSLEEQRVRVFSVDRIAEVTPSEKRRFVVPADFDLSTYVHGPFGVHAPDDPKRVIIEFDADAAPEIRSRRWHASQRLATAADGRVRLSVLVSDLEAVRTWVMSYGAHARVVEPPALVQAVKDELSRAHSRYEE